MKKFLIAPLLLLLMACAAQTTSESVEGTGPASTSPVPSETVQEEPGEPTIEAEPAEESSPSQPTAVSPASTSPEEAALIRPQDHVLGADEPLITIIEYGDFQ